MTFDGAYQDELTQLREAGRALAARHPGVASMLAAPSPNPDIERLLQGFAFVAARLRERVDSAAPALAESLTELLLPAALRPTPAATIVAFQPAPGMRAAQRIPAGTRLLARDVDGTRCHFRTTRDLTLAPLRLVHARLDQGASTQPTLTLRLTAEGCSINDACRGAPPRLHIHAEPALRGQLALWLGRHVTSVHVAEAHDRAGEQRGVATGRERAVGGQDVVQPIGFEDRDALLPWPAFAPHGPRLIQEYFTLPAKFAFFDLLHLARARLDAGATTIDVTVRFDHPPPIQTRLPDDVLRLHAVPAVNLFDVDAEPLRVDLRERPILLRAAGMDPAHMEVFSVHSVDGIGRGGARTRYEPLHAFAHTRVGGCYALTRRPSTVDAGTHTFLSLRRDVETARARPDETLSVALTCTNRALPRTLAVGDVATPSADVPAGVTFSNIAAVTAPVCAPLGSALLGQLVGSLACTRVGLADRAALKRLLALHAARGVTDGADDPRIEAIVDVRVETLTRVVAGAAVRGSRYHVVVAQTAFASEGDAYVFGRVLHSVLALDARLNSFADLWLTLAPGARCMHYTSELVR